MRRHASHGEGDEKSDFLYLAAGVVLYTVAALMLVAFLYAAVTAFKAGAGIDKLARMPLSEVLWLVAIASVERADLFFWQRDVPPHRRLGLFSASKISNEMLDAVVYAAVVVFMVIRPFGIQAFQIPSASMEPTLIGGPGKSDDYIVANKAIYRYTHPQSGDIVVFRPPAYACGPEQKDADGQPKVDFIKRCIGVPGDLIEIRGGVLYRNGQPFKEPLNAGANTNDWKLVKYEGDYAPWKGRYIPVTLDFTGKANHSIDGVAVEFAIGAVDNPHMPGAPYVMNWKLESELTREEHDRLNYLSQAPAAKIPAGHYLMMGDNREHSFDGRAWGLIAEDQVVGRSEVIWLPLNRWRTTR